MIGLIPGGFLTFKSSSVMSSKLVLPLESLMMPESSVDVDDAAPFELRLKSGLIVIVNYLKLLRHGLNQIFTNYLESKSIV